MQSTYKQSPEVFGVSPAGETIWCISIQAGDYCASVITWGASLQSFLVDGLAHSLIIGAPTAEDYFTDFRCYGAIVGPVANRINAGRIHTNGKIIDLERNENGRTHLHGGSQGFSNRNWQLRDYDQKSVCLSLHHPDGLGGFPGNILATVTYKLSDEGKLSVELTGMSDQVTWFSPAVHAYWTLDGSKDLSNHRLTVFADHYLPVNTDKIPLGDVDSVVDTEFNYSRPQTPRLGLDHNFCLTNCAKNISLRRACCLETRALRLDVETTEPGLQLYYGKAMPVKNNPRNVVAGLAIEPQGWPNAVNEPDFPSVDLLPEKKYQQLSCFTVTKKLKNFEENRL